MILAYYRGGAQYREARLQARRENRGLRNVTGALSAPQIDSLIVNRMDHELKLYKKAWLAMFLYSVFMASSPFLIPLRGELGTNYLDILQAANQALPWGAISVVVVIIFSTYPSENKIRQLVSSWGTNPIGFEPQYMSGGSFHPNVGPRSIYLRLILAIFVLSFNVMFPSILMVLWLQSFAGSLIVFGYFLIFLSLLGLIFHRLRVAKVVRKIIRETAPYHG